LDGGGGVLGAGVWVRLQIMRPVCRSQLQDLFDEAAAAISGARKAKQLRAMRGRCCFTRPAYTVMAACPNSGLSQTRATSELEGAKAQKAQKARRRKPAPREAGPGAGQQKGR
jgi:hypothetical protein